MGFGTTHKVNNLILQGTFGDKRYPTISYLKKKRCHHSFISDSSPAEASYHHKKVWLLQYFLSPRISEACKFLFDDSNKCQFLWSVMLKKKNWLENPKLSRISNSNWQQCQSIGYLDCIDSYTTETEMSTINQVWTSTYTGWKVSVFGVFLALIFPHSYWMQRDTPYLLTISPSAGKHGPEKLRIRTLFR